MSRLDDLPPDQLAALSLLLRRGKRYAEVAQLLSIPEPAVHDRAHAALAVLAPAHARELTAQQRAEIGDYLLSQQTSTGERLRTRTLLEGSAPARAWASALATELASLASGPLPEIPEPSTAPAGPSHATTREPASAGAAPSPASSSRTPSFRPSSAGLPSSRVGGAVLLGAILVAAVVAVVLLSGGGSRQHPSAAAATTPSSSSATSSASTSSSGATKATEDKRITLTPTDPSSKSIGVAEVLSEGDKYAFYMAAEHLPPSHGFFYAIWLYNSPTSFQALSRSPAVGSDGRMQGGALLPANAGNYHEMLLTMETSERPTHPGPVVLHGPFALH